MKLSDREYEAKLTNYLVAPLHNLVYPMTLDPREQAALRYQRQVSGNTVISHSKFQKSWRTYYSVRDIYATHFIQELNVKLDKCW